MVYLGILVTRKYIGSQKILTEITDTNANASTRHEHTIDNAHTYIHNAPLCTGVFSPIFMKFLWCRAAPTCGFMSVCICPNKCFVLGKVGGWDLVCWLYSQMKDWAKFYGRWKTTFGGRWPSVEDNFYWKTTFGGRWPLVEDNLRWKTTFGGEATSK